jgi:hypothetical protein
MEQIRISERKLILFTVGLLIVAGIVRLGFYKLGVWLFYLAFAPIVLYRLRFYIRNNKNLQKVDRNRLYTLGVIIATIILNLLGFQDVEFVLLFVLAVDYLIVVQNPKTVSGEESRNLQA